MNSALILALSWPYGISDSGEMPSFAAISLMGRILAAWAISMSLFGLTLCCPYGHGITGGGFYSKVVARPQAGRLWANNLRFSNWFTPVSTRSTYTENLSKKRTKIDIFLQRVDSIITFEEYVDKKHFYRHILATCRRRVRFGPKELC
jgi:hypothetical protein